MRMPSPLLIVAIGALLALEAVGLMAQPGYNRVWFVSVVLAQGAAYLLAVMIWRRAPARIGVSAVLAVAALLRIGPLLGPVIWSSDIYRYVWDGRVQNAGINPYCCLPVDARLADLRDATVWPLINRANTAPTIYPPAAQVMFAVTVWLRDSVFAMKLMMLAAEALGIWAMLCLLRRLGRPSSQLLLYAWHPLPAWEIAGSGHVDALVVAFVPLALLAAQAGRRGWAGVALGAAVLSKFLPVVLGPAIWRPRRGDGDWRFAFACVLTVVALYLPYLSVGTRVLGYLPGYANEENLTPDSGRGFWFVELLRTTTGLTLPGGIYLATAGLLMLGLGIAALCRPAGDAAMLRWSVFLSATFVVLISPHYPWYFIWPLVPAALAGALPVVWLPLTAALLYMPDAENSPVLVGGTIYGGFLIWTSIAALRSRRET